MRKNLNLKANELNCMSTDYHNHIEGGIRVKHQGTHKYYFEKLFLSFFDYLPAILGKVTGARGTAKRLQTLRLVV